MLIESKVNSLKSQIFQWVIAFALFLPTGAHSESEYTPVGDATYRYWGFKLYDASFLAACSDKNQSKVSPHKTWDPSCGYKLTLHYSRSFTPEDFTKSSKQMLERILEGGFADIEEEFNRFRTFFDNVESGDSYTLIHTPKRGIALYLNDEKKGEVASLEFSKAYFSIWLSEKGIDDDNAKRLRGLSS